MKTAAIICEFNPFHNGHKYLIDKVKSEHADCVVAIMSGNFVQRGDVAITDKFERAKTALENSCDLVVELPTVFALSSAERFAKGAVQISDALNADILAFGAENDDISTLSRLSELFYDESFNLKVKEYLINGEYYPKAVSCAVSEIYGDDYAEILSGANNTLAIEYIKVLKETSISPVAIKRIGASHDSFESSNNIASATHIRKLIQTNQNYEDFVAEKVPYHTNIKNLETAILYKLKTMSKEEIEKLPDVTEGLHNRVFESARYSNSLEELYTNLKTKRYTLARLRRIVMCALLSITKDDVSNDAQYIRVLGMSQKGATLLSGAKLPLVCKFPQDYDKLNDTARNIIDFDLKAGDIFSLACDDSGCYKNELKRKLIKI
ncbi:MAG: nucleotidyltransferase family protein [Ruminococcus sp.]|nr:nucleotidyltransferase family protein [Ruminococcus sp.]